MLSGMICLFPPVTSYTQQLIAQSHSAGNMASPLPQQSCTPEHDIESSPENTHMFSQGQPIVETGAAPEQ